MGKFLYASIAAAFFFCLACGSDDGGSGSECIPGEVNCECNMGSCLAGLVCEANICMTPAGEGDGDSTGDGDGDTGDGDGDTGDGDGDDGDGDGTPGDGDGETCGAGEELCNNVCTNVMDDDANCGMCGNACEVVGNTGGCNNGTCEPALSECVLAEDPPKSCNEICSDFGKTCADKGCNGITYVWYGAFSSCEQLSGSPNQNDCSNPTLMSGTTIRCCCQ